MKQILRIIEEIGIGIIVAAATLFISGPVMVCNYKDMLIECRNGRVFHNKGTRYLYGQYVLVTLATLFCLTINTLAIIVLYKEIIGFNSP